MSSSDSALLQEMESLHLTEDQFQRLPQEDQLRYLVLLKEEAALRKRVKSTQRYVPNPKQEAFHLSKAPTRAIFGGNRSGKTTAGGLEFIWHVTGTYPDWYPLEQRFNRPVKGRIIASDFTNGVGGVIIPFLEEWLDESIVARKVRNPLGVYVKWILKNGSAFDILTHEQETKNFEGWKGDIAWFDEPPPRDRYIATARGMVDTGGRIWLTLTPLKAPWIYDEIYKKHDEVRTFVITMEMRDNLKRVENGRQIGVLTESAIQDFESKLNSDEKLARMHGAFMHLVGRVYPQFDPRAHVMAPIKIQAHWPRYMCVDPHPRKPTAVVWLAVDEHENHYIYDELSFAGDAQQIANMIQAQEGSLKAHQRFIDPAMDKDNNLFGGANTRTELAKHGVYCQRANNDFDLGYNRLCEALRPQYSALYKSSVPRLHVFNTCVKTIFEFEHYMWGDYKRNPEDHDLKEKVVKKNDDFMDCIRYIYNAGPRYYEVMPEKSEPEVVYKGQFAKYPTRQVVDSGARSSYYSHTERDEDGY